MNHPPSQTPTPPVQPLKRGLVGLLAATIFSQASLTMADSPEKAILKAMGEQYLRSQVTYRTAELINKNHAFFKSGDPNLGTKVVDIVGKAMAVYGFVTAKNDRERFWSGVNLFITPEPTTALILMTLQFADMLMNIRAQEQIQATNIETMKFQVASFKSFRQMEEAKNIRLEQLFNEHSSLMGSIHALQEELNESGVSKFIANAASEPLEMPTAEEVSLALHKIRHLEGLLDQLEINSQFITASLGREINPNADVYKKAVQDNNASFDSIRSQIDEFSQKVRLFLASFQVEEFKAQLAKEKSPYASDLRIYSKCTSLVNQAKTSEFWKKESSDDESGFSTSDCEERYSFLKEK